MKLLHTSDWHLGRSLNGRSLLEDQRWLLEHQFLPWVEREKPTCILLAGDVYDRQIPPAEAIQLFEDILSRLVELSVKVCVISGNHDGPERMTLLRRVLRQSGVYFATDLSDALDPVVLEQDGEKLQIFLVPYFDAPRARAFLKNDSLRGEGPCMEAILEKLKPLFLPDAGHVLVSHCFAAGSQLSQSENPLFVGGSAQVPTSLFDPFDYVALGHLHGPQRAGEKACYCGSLLKYSVDEEHQKKGYFQLEWDGKEMHREFLPCQPLRDVRKLSGLLEDLVAQGRENPCQDYVMLELTDQRPLLMPAETLRPYYPNLLAVSQPWVTQSVIGHRSTQLKGLDDLAVFTAFLRDCYGMDVEKEDQALFQEIFREVQEEN